MVKTNAQTRNKSVFIKHFSLFTIIPNAYSLLLDFLQKTILDFHETTFIGVMTQLYFSVITMVRLSSAINNILYYFKRMLLNL